jgi:hypothetical protein
MSINIKQCKLHTVYNYNNNTGNIQDKANKYFHRGKPRCYSRSSFTMVDIHVELILMLI